MGQTGQIRWSVQAVDIATPVVGVIPVPPSAAPRHLTVEGLTSVQVEPWKVSRTGMVSSYRVAGLASAGGSGIGTVELLEGSVTVEDSFAFHPDVAHLIANRKSLRIGFDDIRGERYESELLVGGRDLVGGSAEKSATYGGPLQRIDGQARTGFWAQCTAYHDQPFVLVEALWHNADADHVYGDVYHSGLALQVPEGFHALRIRRVTDGDDVRPLPTQCGRKLTWIVARIGQAYAVPAQFEVLPDVDSLSWSNPLCRSYLPQGLPVEAEMASAASRASDLEIAALTGEPFDWMSSPSLEGFHAEGAGYGGAGSSYGVERFGDVGLALHGHGEALRIWQAATINRHAGFLYRTDGEPIRCDDYTDHLDRLPWRFFLNPNARYTYEGVAGRNANWPGGKDFFGFASAPSFDEDYAAAHGIDVPSKDAVYSYAAHDRQHGMRGLRATLPLAYICGDRFSARLLREHAATARAEFWEGNGDSDLDRRVGWLYESATDHPKRGLYAGREDAWAIQTVLSACELNQDDWARQFDRWLARYSHALRDAQMPYRPTPGATVPGLIQAMGGSKELDEFGGEFAVCQGYQESMLAWAAWGIANYYDCPEASTSADQAFAMLDLFGRDPLYKITVRHFASGDVLTNKEQQAAYPFPVASYSQSDFVPTLAMMALVQRFPNDDQRQIALEWCADVLGVPVEGLATWTPPTDSMERQAACVAPIAAWLKRRGLLGG